MAFSGWPAEALEFYDGLLADNSKTYWTEHRAVYDEQVRAPMTELLAELEPEFGTPKIFRPNRDVRFSNDKSPYKTHIGAVLADGGYVQLSSTGLATGSGMYAMATDQLERYRRAVDDDRTGMQLVDIIADAARQKIRIAGHDSLKTAPRGYPRVHPRIEPLCWKGVVAWREWPVAAWLGTPAAKRRVVEFLRAAAPLNEWLDANVGPTALDTGRR